MINMYKELVQRYWPSSYNNITYVHYHLRAREVKVSYIDVFTFLQAAIKEENGI